MGEMESISASILKNGRGRTVVRPPAPDKEEDIQGVMYLAPDDPFLTIPPPAVEKLPATLVYEWDDARVQVEYSVGLVEVLLGDEADKESHGGGIWQKDPWEYGGEAGEPLTF